MLQSQSEPPEGIRLFTFLSLEGFMFLSLGWGFSKSVSVGALAQRKLVCNKLILAYPDATNRLRMTCGICH